MMVVANSGPGLHDECKNFVERGFACPAGLGRLSPASSTTLFHFNQLRVILLAVSWLYFVQIFIIEIPL
jgi:hypothetical protein